MANKMNIIDAYLSQNTSGTGVGIQTRARVTNSAHIGYCKFRRLSSATADANLDNIVVSTNPADTAQTAELSVLPAITEIKCTIAANNGAGDLVIEFQSETGGAVQTNAGSYYTLVAAP